MSQQPKQVPCIYQDCSRPAHLSSTVRGSVWLCDEHERKVESQQPKWTAGPWERDAVDDSDYGWEDFQFDEIYGADGDLTALAVRGPNARLIAAAPELVEALQEALALIRETVWVDDSEVPPKEQVQIEAALRKAGAL